MTLGEKIKTLRSIKGYSQEFVAEKIGISPSTLSKIERNEVEANWSRMNEIATVLEVSVSELASFGEKNVFNMSGGTNNGFMGNVVMGTANEMTMLLNRIAKLETELKEIKEKLAVFPAI